MVRHETGDVAVVVMLSPTEEAGREKCYQYCPVDEQSDPIIVHASHHEGDQLDGQVTFVELEETAGESTFARKLHLTFGEETKVVWHLLFTAFPDFGVPEDADRAELLELLKLADRKNTPGPSNPKIIHCSAGVGRTGTFIALDHLLGQLDCGAISTAMDQEDPVLDVVHCLREQRMMMVQMDAQFEFLYAVLREEYQKKIARENVKSAQPSPKMRRIRSGSRLAVQSELVQATQTDDEANQNDDGAAEHEHGDETGRDAFEISDTEREGEELRIGRDRAS